MIEERIRLTMSGLTDQRRRFKQLEEMTGIAADRWSSVSLKRQRPTVEMLEALCKQNPDLSLWLTTGRTHLASGQVDIQTKIAKRKVDIWHARTKSKTGLELTTDEQLALAADEAFEFDEYSHLLPDFTPKK